MGGGLSAASGDAGLGSGNSAIGVLGAAGAPGGDAASIAGPRGGNAAAAAGLALPSAVAAAVSGGGVARSRVAIAAAAGLGNAAGFIGGALSADALGRPRF